MNTYVPFNQYYSYRRDMSKTFPWFEFYAPYMESAKQFVIRENVGIIHQMALEIASLRDELAELRDEHSEYVHSVTGEPYVDDAVSVEHDIITMNYDGASVGFYPVETSSIDTLPEPSDNDDNSNSNHDSDSE